MSTPSQSTIGIDLASDPRRELVERVIASPSFAKSQRLCSVLVFICDLSLDGRNGEINEITIGREVFGRAPDYDPSIDGIVRSHASRLRQRLEQYFNEEGRDEKLHVSIPKGGYVPVFTERTPLLEEQTEPELETQATTLSVEPWQSIAPAVDRKPRGTLAIWLLSFAFVIACSCAVYLLATRTSRIRASIPAAQASLHPLWGVLFGSDHPTLVICSDTALTIFENLTHSDVKLAEYLDGAYRVHANAPGAASPEVIQVLAQHRYTSIVDLEIVSKLFHLTGAPANRIQVLYARDLRPNDLKSGSAILLGTQEGNPWIELFENQMNFRIRHNHTWGSFSVLNRVPEGNELPQYDTAPADATHKVYGLIALRPNLGGSGQVLILEGTSMAGTECSADFIFNDSQLMPFLNKIRLPNGALPYFEVLLRSSNMNGNASQSEIVAYRVSQS